MEKEFESYWSVHQKRLIERAPAALREERKESGRMNTAGDWILEAFPIVAVVAFMNYGFVGSELLNFLLALVVGVIVFTLINLIKPYVTGKRNIGEIDKDIKAYFYKIYQEQGLNELEKQ